MFISKTESEKKPG